MLNNGACEENADKKEMKRVNIRVTPLVYKYFMSKSKNTGVSMSSLMYLALEDYVKQQQLIFENMPDMLRQMQLYGFNGNGNSNVK